MRHQKFSLGQAVATTAALRALEENQQSALDFIKRHAQGDWGDVCHEDAALNDAAVEDGSRILSAYTLKNCTKIWIITESKDESGQRQATTVLLPEDY